MAEAWVIKPLDALRLRRATDAALAGDTYHEGIPKPPTIEIDQPDVGTVTEDPATPEEEPTPAG
jgi:hypothetical protein